VTSAIIKLIVDESERAEEAFCTTVCLGILHIGSCSVVYPPWYMNNLQQFLSL